jgi:bifunctional DNA-binding transcriptional regulator/antitoxin component of YhaV-PrlF toxin-antitoxin module
MVFFMEMRKRMKISKGGQISIPAPIRKRWATSTVTLDDQGDQIVLKPAPDDPIGAAAGAFAGEGPKIDWEAVAREEREAEAEAEDRKLGR